MNFTEIVYNCKHSYALYLRLREYDANVVDMGEKGVFVHAYNITEGEYQEMIEICKQFGDLKS